MFPFTKLRRATLSSVRAEEELKVYCFGGLGLGLGLGLGQLGGPIFS